MVVLGGGAVSYERGTPVSTRVRTPALLVEFQRLFVTLSEGTPFCFWGISYRQVGSMNYPLVSYSRNPVGFHFAFQTGLQGHRRILWGGQFLMSEVPLYGPTLSAIPPERKQWLSPGGTQQGSHLCYRGTSLIRTPPP